MKKYLIMCAAMAVTLSFTSCGLFNKTSKDSAYKKAYEKALAAEQNNNTATTSTITETQTTTIEEIPVAPVVNKSYQETSSSDYSESIPVRQESYSMINGDGLKAYSVVVGSFGVKANAERLQETLRKDGYNAQIVRTANNLFRVVAATSDTKKDAAIDRDRLRGSYADAWILAR